MAVTTVKPGLLENSFNHFVLTWRLFFHPRVPFLLRAFFIGLPLLYGVIPFALDVIPDFIPIIGFMDDLILLVIASLIFVSACPRDLVSELRGGQGSHTIASRQLEACRYPTENRDLAAGFFVVTMFILFSGYLGGLVLAGFFFLGYLGTSFLRARMMASSIEVTPHQFEEYYPLLHNAMRGLPPTRVNLMVTQNPAMNAFAFGYHE
jgi:uncharacterized membrane protein YkvA (DUF1232 family)